MKTARKNNGFVLILSMIFMVVFACLAVSLGAISNTNLQLAKNHQSANRALSAALSGIEYGKIKTQDFTSEIATAYGVSDNQMKSVWKNYRTHFLDHPCNGNCHHCRSYAQNGKNVEEFYVPDVDYGVGDFKFSLRFVYNENEPDLIIMESTGSDGTFSKKITMEMHITKDNRVLKYAVASRGRVWLTSQTVVDGDIYSSWDATRYGSAGIETTSEVVNNGTLSVINSLEELKNANVQMETLDSNNNPVFDINGERVYSHEDAVQGYHEGIEYDTPMADLPGMNEDDYDTSTYKNLCKHNVIPSSWTRKEYFPHREGDYTRSSSGSVRLYRHVYYNQTFTDAFLPKGRNALFVNCKFNGVLFVESQSNTTSTSKCNNVRFDDCEFNGVIVTDVPKNNSINWRQNSLYFTGGAYFENEWSSQEATILAPNFNVNLGNTTELELDHNSQLKGAVVGGIVDVRGLVDIDGTIISMYDTKYHSSGYVTNIGSTDDDGGSEGGAFTGEDIRISPSQQQLLPEGIKADVVILIDNSSYREY